MAWLNPVPDDHWDYTSSICIIKDLFEDRMYPLTLKVCQFWSPEVVQE